MDLSAYRARARVGSCGRKCIVPPREARCFDVGAGRVFQDFQYRGAAGWRSEPVVGQPISGERFFSGKTRALHGTHLSTGDRMWSNLPYLRAMATITEDTLDWYGFDDFGGSVHDVIGTRCDPYTHNLLWRRAVSSLLPFQPVARYGGASGDAAARGRSYMCMMC